VGLLTGSAALYFFESTRVEFAANAANPSMPPPVNRSDSAAGSGAPDARQRQHELEVELARVSSDALREQAAHRSFAGDHAASLEGTHTSDDEAEIAGESGIGHDDDPLERLATDP
jgi:hypothetical protein